MFSLKSTSRARLKESINYSFYYKLWKMEIESKNSFKRSVFTEVFELATMGSKDIEVKS